MALSSWPGVSFSQLPVSIRRPIVNMHPGIMQLRILAWAWPCTRCKRSWAVGLSRAKHHKRRPNCEKHGICMLTWGCNSLSSHSGSFTPVQPIMSFVYRSPFLCIVVLHAGAHFLTTVACTLNMQITSALPHTLHTCNWITINLGVLKVSILSVSVHSL